jgi:restriction system protein
MPFPDFQSMMLPFLQFAADGKDHELSDAAEHIAAQFKLTDAQRAERLPSGSQSRFLNRIGWCRTHLKHAGLVEYVRRGVFRISPKGIDLLAQKPGNLTLKSLDQYTEHRAWFHQKPSKQNEKTIPAESTPEEQIEALIEGLKETLAGDLLDRIKAMDPFRFERVVLDLLVAMGYGGARTDAASVTPKSNDGGIDGLINEDRLGLDVIYVQAKCWKDTNVGSPDIQKFVGAIDGKRAAKGIFITTSDFAPAALDYARTTTKRVILINGQRLAELMVEHNIGVSRTSTYELKRVDSDYFEEG